MNKIIHRGTDRGDGSIGWLQSKFSFSFANWYDPNKMGFGSLRVINDDQIAPSSGFGLHPHQNMEIITIVTEGTVTHTDSLGNQAMVKAGEVQVMSAGTGVAHAEKNDSPSETLKLFQIWIEPNVRNVTPSYHQKDMYAVARPNELQLLISPTGEAGSLPIHQEAYIYRLETNQDQAITYPLHNTRNGVYLFVISGSVDVAGEVLAERDAIGLTDLSEVSLRLTSGSDLLIFEV